MLLGARETVVRSAYAVLEGPGTARSRRRPGVLYLTTERLVFEAPGSRGLVRDLVDGRDVEILVDDPLASLRNASVRRGRWSRVRLVVDRPGDRSAFDVLEPEAWALAISEARRYAELAREGPRTGPLDGRGTVVKLRCRYCGSLGDEGTLRCPACGASF
jgi:hypothetical protein